MPKEILITDSVPGQVYIFNPPGALKVAKVSRGSSGLTAKVTIEGTYVEPPVDPPPPIDPAPIVTAGPTASAITQSGATITWSLSEKATGFIEYGPNFSLKTPAESSFDYQTHVQNLSGLTANTDHPFRVVGEDQAGQAYSKIGSVKTLAVPVEPPPTGSYPPDTTLRAVTPDTTSPRPAYLQEVSDTTWGTKIRTISNVNMYRNGYSIQPAYNADSTIIFLGYGRRFLDAATYQDLGQLPSGVEYPVWSSIDPKKMYGVSSNRNVVKEFTYGETAWREVATFSEYVHLDFGGYSGNVSDDDRICFITRNSSGVYGAMVYDAKTRIKMSAVNFGYTSTPTETAMSRSGQYVTICHPTVGTGEKQGTGAYRASDLSYIRHMADDRPHSDNGKDAQGRDIWVYCDYSNLVSHRYVDGVKTNLSGGVTAVGHVSCANYKYPGWAYVTCNRNNAGAPGNQQLLAVKTDGSQTVRVFGWTHQGGNTQYEADPMAVASPDGTKMIWGGRWNNTGDILCWIAGMDT